MSGLPPAEIPPVPEDAGAAPRTPEADAALPLEARFPPEVVATPSQVRTLPGDEITWWRPSWRDGWEQVGYRWIFLTPALGLLVLLGLAWRYPFFSGVLTILGFKLFIAVAAIAISLAGFVVRRAAIARREPFCIFCGYNLTGLPDDYRCPECGRPYTWKLIAEYRRDPRWFIERYRALGKLPAPATPFEAGAVRRQRSRDGT